ncbi:MAG: phosphatase PAP2 family protein [Clostridia bacterium]|nr:phosphatase PAP2 family protein [Clostridia bacterium]
MNRLKLKFKYGTLLLFWPLFGLVFLFLERFRTIPYYIPTYCRVDDIIPFNEWFIIPYMFWFVYLIGMISYTFFKDKTAFVHLMKYLMFANTLALIIFIVFPTCQNLRPSVFPRDNFLTRFIGKFYLFDTNTNVAPSLHVVDSVAVLTASMNMKRFRTKGWRICFATACLFICASTVFLKQHSIVDVFIAVPVCFAADIAAYGEPIRINSRKQRIRV